MIANGLCTKRQMMADNLHTWRTWYPQISRIRQDLSGEVAWYFTYSQFMVGLSVITGCLQLGVLIHHAISDNGSNDDGLTGPFLFYASRIENSNVYIHWQVVTLFIYLLHLMHPWIYRALVHWLIESGREEDPNEGRYDTHSAHCLDIIVTAHVEQQPTEEERRRGKRLSIGLFCLIIFINIGVNVAVFQYLNGLNNVWVTLSLGVVLELFQLIWLLVCYKTTTLELHRTSTIRSNWTFVKVFVFSVATTAILLWLKQLFRTVLRPSDSGNDSSTTGVNFVSSQCVMDNITNDFQILLFLQFLTGSVLSFAEPTFYRYIVAWLRIHTRWVDDCANVSHFNTSYGYAKLMYREFLLLGCAAVGLHIGLLVATLGLLDVILAYVKIRFRWQTIPERLQNDYSSILWKANLALWIVAVFLPPTGVFHIVTGRTTSPSCHVWYSNRPLI